MIMNGTSIRWFVERLKARAGEGEVRDLNRQVAGIRVETVSAVLAEMEKRGISAAEIDEFLSRCKGETRSLEAAFSGFMCVASKLFAGTAEAPEREPDEVASNVLAVLEVTSPKLATIMRPLLGLRGHNKAARELSRILFGTAQQSRKTEKFSVLQKLLQKTAFGELVGNAVLAAVRGDFVALMRAEGRLSDPQVIESAKRAVTRYQAETRETANIAVREIRKGVRKGQGIRTLGHWLQAVAEAEPETAQRLFERYEVRGWRAKSYNRRKAQRRGLTPPSWSRACYEQADWSRRR